MLEQMLSEFRKNKITAMLLIMAILILLYYTFVYRLQRLEEKERKAQETKGYVAPSTSAFPARSSVNSHSGSAAKVELVKPDQRLLDIVFGFKTTKEYQSYEVNPFRPTGMSGNGSMGLGDPVVSDVELVSKKIKVTYRGFYSFEGKKVAVLNVSILKEGQTYPEKKLLKITGGELIGEFPVKIIDMNSKTMEVISQVGRYECQMNIECEINYMARK